MVFGWSLIFFLGWVGGGGGGGGGVYHDIEIYGEHVPFNQTQMYLFDLT